MSEPTPPFPASVGPAGPTVFVLPPPPRRRWWLHGLMLALTVLTTLVVGARLQHNFDFNLPAYATEADFFPLAWVLEHPARLLLGIPFSFTLLAILLAHEMGHFLFCLRYRVFATLPFFIPAPTLIGTFGAFIRIRSPIPSRRALFDIGIAGPIAGFVLAVAALAWGMMLSRNAPMVVSQSELQFGYPWIFHLLRSALPLENLHGALGDIYFHPVAFAAWVGMFATALNLVPGGQLDGGHIVYALAPGAHRRVSFLAAVALIPLGFFFWYGWFMWTTLLLITGTRHPRVPPWPGLGSARLLLAVFALVMLLVTFVPAPFAGAALE